MRLACRMPDYLLTTYRETGSTVTLRSRHAAHAEKSDSQGSYARQSMHSITPIQEKPAMDNQAVINQLNEILKHEWTGVAQYSQAGFIIEGVWREVYAEKFLEDAEESFGHAKLVGDKIVALGGVPVVLRNEVKQSRDLREVLEFSLAFESKAVEMYGQAIDLAEGNKALVIFLEDILKDEQEGVDEYAKLLRETPASQAELTSAKRTG